MERSVLPVWDRAVSVIRRKSEASSEALEAPSIMRTHLGGEVHNGACLLSDTEMDYPMTEDPIELMKTVKSKTIATSFRSQLDAIESLYSQQIRLNFTHQDVEQILRNEPYYPQEIKDRVRDVVFQQKSRYSYLF